MSDTEKTAETTPAEEVKIDPTQKELRSKEEIELEQKMVKVISAMPKKVQTRF